MPAIVRNKKLKRIMKFNGEDLLYWRAWLYVLMTEAAIGKEKAIASLARNSPCVHPEQVQYWEAVHRGLVYCFNRLEKGCRAATFQRAAEFVVHNPTDRIPD
jgi:hypothetical protein